MDPSILEGALPAQPWSLLLGQVGTVAVLVALGLHLSSTVLWAASAKNPALEKWAKWAFNLGCLGFVVAIGVVVALFVKDQFQYKYVFSHGAKDTELQYKIAGAWSGQEGSILLWGTASALFGLLAVRFTRQDRRWFSIVYSLFLASVAGILAYESPFKLNPLIDGKALVPTTGEGLNPTLMNYWVVIHPPVIFGGFGSLTVLFAWSLAALLRRDLTTWIPLVRPWALISLTLLGLGLAMGGFWAYETLGWGGFWMWDPVENTSFVPWVATAAFLHGLFVQVSRQRWFFTNALLAGLPFLLFAYGTFLTRSGFLGDTSVHSFAEMNRSALWILMSMIFVGLVSFLAVWGVRTWQMRESMPQSKPMKPAPFNREVFMALGIWLLVGFGVVTAIGMSVPFLQNISGQKPKVVEEPLYNTVLSFLFLPLTIAMAVGPFLTWKGLGFRAFVSRFVNIVAVVLFLVGCTLLALKFGGFGIPADQDATTKLLLSVPVNRVGWVMTLTGFCYFAIVATLWKLFESLKKSRSSVGGMLTHLGVSVAILGLIFSRGLEQKQEAFVITSTKPTTAMGYTLQAIGPTSTFTDRHNKIQVAVTEGKQKYTVSPGLYFRGMDENGEPLPFIWPAIHGRGTYDLYLVLHNITMDASGPTEMKQGDQRLLKEEGMLVTYNGMKSEGPLGQAGATFKADVTVQIGHESYTVQPALRLGEAGMESLAANVGKDYTIKLVSMNAADKGATLQIGYQQPAYVAELFYKPLTLFVWLGVGIMTVGGGLTAWTRRYRRVSEAEAKATSGEQSGRSVSPDRRHAPEPVAQS